MLVGANGAGKSNFLSVFKLLNEISSEHLGIFTTKSGGASKLLYLGKKVTDAIKINIDFEDTTYRCVLEPTTVADQLIFTDESVSYSELSNRPDVSNAACLITNAPAFPPKGKNETDLRAWSDSKRVANEVLNTFKKWHVYHFNDTSEKAPMKDNCNIDDNRFLRADAGT